MPPPLGRDVGRWDRAPGRRRDSVGLSWVRAQPCCMLHSCRHWEKQFVNFIPFCFMVWWLNRIRPSLDSISVGSDTALQVKIGALTQMMRNGWGVWTLTHRRALAPDALWARETSPCVHVVTWPELHTSHNTDYPAFPPALHSTLLHCNGPTRLSTHWEEASVFMQQWNRIQRWTKTLSLPRVSKMTAFTWPVCV